MVSVMNEGSIKGHAAGVAALTRIICKKLTDKQLVDAILLGVCDQKLEDNSVCYPGAKDFFEKDRIMKKSTLENINSFSTRTFRHGRIC